ncbi:hypothetical protein L249_3075 [Ophiocordyceps polyrhachis-furcata BCC 54312]|uniref:Putative lipoate-protein ligase A n=1 Tax=Ophiocordyceps polyrhachis-furcata BCC 54312 TaxID=1330021 RepID=A0A367LRX2_9HYPO|nr:hypothetical protein L249_3075 [Ophiocordyceps polyrhachis-furcata BCC 54312]
MRRISSAARCGARCDNLTAGARPTFGPAGFHRRLSTEAASNPANTAQVYLSRSHDPLVNLAVEHHLLRTTAPTSTVLLLYVNEPCVVLGRNQNPWLETNLAQLAGKGIGLIRRRSGGGTVFHDLGNVNYSVICPTAAFDRDRHAQMVVRALAVLDRRARVNERHDIVLDDGGRPFKISGSAYKLTRLRSLHHGTCLLRTPNLGMISGLLRSPAEPFIKARGVESVRSKVANVDLDNEDFEAAVVEQFRAMYGGRCHVYETFGTEDALAVGGVIDAYRETNGSGWLYGQTPQFTLSTHPTKDDARPRPSLPFNKDLRFRFVARHGKLEQVEIEAKGQHLGGSAIVGLALHEVSNWVEPLLQARLDSQLAVELGAWLDSVLGNRLHLGGGLGR